MSKTFVLIALLLVGAALGGGAGMPEVFAPGSVSGPAPEAYIAFSPDGKIAYFTRYSAFAAESFNTIYVSDLGSGRWGRPRVAEFSGRYSDHTPLVSPDGARLYFVSKRPVGSAPKDDYDIWFVEKKGKGWGSPVHLDPPINSPSNELSPAVAANGALYFSSTRPGGLGAGDIYRSAWDGSKHLPPENLGPAVNSPGGEWGVCVSRDEGLLVFESSGRAENLSFAGDLYIARRGAGGWERAVSLGAQVNSEASDLAPRLSHDGRLLFFASNRRGDNLDIYYTPLPAPPAR